MNKAADTEEIDEVLESDEPEVSEEDEVEEVEATEESEDEAEGDEEEESEVTVSIGDEAPPASEEDDDDKARPWVKELRKKTAEQNREIRDLRDKLKAATQPAVPAKVELGKKPTLQDCDYDEDKFATDLEEWHLRKQEVADQERKQIEAQKAEEKAFNDRLEAHNKLKSELKVKDFGEAEEAIQDAFSVQQRGMIIDGADNSALMFYALGKNPKKLAELASIKNPVKFAFAVAKLETQLKVTPTKKAPLPEKTVRGSAGSTSVVDSKMARLEAEAERSKDRSKVIAYRAELRAKGK